MIADNNLAAVLTIDGNYFQSGGTFSALLHGTGIQIDKVDVTAGHTVTLTGGDLHVSGITTFTLGQEFDDIMTFQPGQLTGTFATIQGGNGDIGNGLRLFAIYDNVGGDISIRVGDSDGEKVWIDATGNWTTNPENWMRPGVPVATDNVRIGNTTTGDVTLDNTTTVNRLRIDASNALRNTSGTTLTVTTTVANSGSLTLAGDLTALGAVTNNSGATLAMQGGTLTAPSFSNAGTTSGFGTIAPAITNSGLVQASGGTLTAQKGIQGTIGNITINPAAALSIGANSTVGTLSQNGTLALGSNNITVSTDYNNANFGTGNSFNKRANVTGTGQILAAGPSPDNMQVITGSKVTGGNTANPTLALGTVHVGDQATYQIANQGTAANPSLRGALQPMTDSLLSGSGITAANFGPIAPGTSTADYLVTAASAGILTNEKVHVANNFGNVREQDLSITGQINRYAALAFLKEGGQGILSGSGNSFVLDFGDVARGSSQEAMLAIFNDNPLADEAFTDLLTSMITAMSGSGFDLTGCSVNRLPGGHGQSGCDIVFDTGEAGPFSKTATFSVESINADFDGFRDPVILTIKGTIDGQPVAEPGTMAMLASGLGMMFLMFSPTEAAVMQPPESQGIGSMRRGSFGPTSCSMQS